ncbi:ERBB receptor feedback inhibitor 1 [Rhinatrema bivittatum]|uniref:ERBB receptor feedback inhibitor 1 n=1 Tax=Rhinatrema bivittatum TaxID=194408 RepID=UPI0011287401|nr:ERBB receptor feedback inhibitor 1 [Rhinatrema bivittatum]XP_029434020.1 ERBB receptor feedback inhibitor 1 [Rhinatrema bivittatum]
MSVAQEIGVSLKNEIHFLNGQGIVNPKGYWASTSGFENTYFDMDPIAMAYNLKTVAPQHLSIGHISQPALMNEYSCTTMRLPSKKPSPLHLTMPTGEHLMHEEEDQVVPSFKKLSMNGVICSERTPPHTPIKNGPPQFHAVPCSDRSSRPLPPLPISEDLLLDDVDSEVEFLTSSETDLLLQDCKPLAFKYGVPGRRSFRGCGQINYAYIDAAAGAKSVDKSSVAPTECIQDAKPQKLEQPHRRLRRSHSGPAGSYNKPAIKISSHLNRASPNSDEDKPEVPPRIPIPPRPVRPDYRRWSAEVTSNTYSDEDRPPKVPPREPLSRSNSRTPSPKSLPSYLNGVMPPTQSFAPDPKYVSNKGLQRQLSEGSANKIPCILPIIENGKKASSTHYYLLPERPPYLDRYEKYITEASAETKVPSCCDCTIASLSAKLDSKPKMEVGSHVKGKSFSHMASP